MSIRKTVIKLVVLCESDMHPSEWSLQDIAEGIDTGPMLGQWSVESTDLVPKDRVQEECEALGNDGSFFPEED